MGTCEICGSERNVVETVIEGVMLNACEKCTKFGNVVEKKNIEAIQKKKILIKEPQISYGIVSDYFIRIKNARELLNIKQKEFALKISEKSSEIYKLESAKIKPSFKLARKIERFLKIKLIEQINEDKTVRINFKDNNITIGDIIKLKKPENE